MLPIVSWPRFARCPAQVAEYWAQQYNKRSPPGSKVAFVVAQALELPRRQGLQRWSSLEPLLSGEYAKFNNNAGAVLGGRTAQSFSHFTVHETGGMMCVCDLQVGKSRGLHRKRDNLGPEHLSGWDGP